MRSCQNERNSSVREFGLTVYAEYEERTTDSSSVQECLDTLAQLLGSSQGHLFGSGPTVGFPTRGDFFPD